MASAEEQLGRAVLKLVTDNSQYNKGLDDAVDRQKGLANQTSITGRAAAAFGASFTGAIAGVAAAFTAAAIKDTLIGIGQGIIDLGVRGSTVADVSAQFEVLNRSIGNNAQTLVDKLDKAFAGTVTRFDAMRASNQALSQGLKLSEDQFSLTARASRVLADRIGGDTKEAYDTLLGVMANGKDMALKTIGLNIDGAAAVEKYAASLGVEASALNESQMIAAKKQAVLAELARVLAESGDAEVDFADRVDQAKVALSNLMDGIAVGIANSPVLAAAMGAFADAFQAAFGPNQTALVDLVVKAVELIAVGLVDAGIYAVEFARVGVQAFGVVQTGVKAFILILATVADVFADTIAKSSELAASLPGVGGAFENAARNAAAVARETQAYKEATQASLASSAQMASGQGVVFDGLNKVSAALVDARARMEAATLAQGTQQAEADKTAAATHRLAGALTAQGDAAEVAGKKTKDVGIITGELGNIVRFQIAGIINPNLVDFQTETHNAADALQEIRDELERINDTAIRIMPPLVSTMKLPWVAAKETVYETKPEIEGFFTKVFGSATTFGQNITGIFQSAFEGGGGALGAVKSFATGAVSNLLGMIPVVGPFVSQFAGPIVAMFGKLASKAKEFFSSLFGGPSKDERAGRSAVAAFEDEVIGALSAQQKAEAGGERWKEVVIGVRDAYMAAGLSAEQAEADVAALWASSKNGAQASADVIERIRRAMSGAADDAVDGVEDIARAIDKIPRSIDIEANVTVNTPGEPGGTEGGDQGYATGTYGRHGSYFHDFRRATRTTLHGREAVVPEGQALPFALDVLGKLAPRSPATPAGPGAPSSSPLAQALDSIERRLGGLGDRLAAMHQQTTMTLATTLRDAARGQV